MTVFKPLVSGETEQQFRQLFSSLFAITSSPLQSRTGVLGASGLRVRQTTTASASVTVDSGVSVSQSSVLTGVTPMVNDSTFTLDVLGANPMGGLPRNDIVVIDAGTSSIRVITGVANASPTDPAVPSSAVPLARLRHAASATTVPTSVIDDLRVFTAMRGGAVTARNQTERDALAQDSTVVYRIDSGTLEVYDGTGWLYFGKTSAAKAGKRTHWGAATGTVDSNGYLTVTHGAGFTPTVAVATPSVAYRVATDAAGPMTFRVRFLLGDGSLVTAGTTVSVSYFVGE